MDRLEQELLALQAATQITSEQKAILSRLTQQTAAWLLSMSVRFIREHQPGRNPDGTYDAQQVLQWWIARERANAVEVAATEGGHESAKARIMEAKAIQEELSAERERGRLVDRDTVHAFLAQLAGMLRQAGDKLQKEFGREALEIMNDAIDGTQQLMRDAL